jgi:O-succinylbenzoate synthase
MMNRMIRIQQIQLREIHLQLKEPFEISSGTSRKRRILLVQLTDGDGVCGWGECVAGEYPNYSSETIDTAWLAIMQWVGPRVLDYGFSRPEEFYALLEKDFRGHSMAKAAVEMAAWELMSRRKDTSLATMLGGKREKIGVGISIGLQENPLELVNRVEKAVACGYRKIKIKIQPGRDLEFVGAVYREFGDRLHWMVDANNAYTLEDAPLLCRLDEFGLMMLEQPLAWDDLLRHAKLQGMLKTPICLDESITCLDRVKDMVELRAGRVINLKPGRVGGFFSSRKIHDFCSKNNIPVWCGGMLESGVGRAHNVALASLPNFRFPGDISPSSRYFERDIVWPEWQMDEEGMVCVPLDKPGMGVDLDMDFVKSLTVRHDSLAA